MKNAGIWLDREKAYIIRISDQATETEVVPSNLEFFHPKGGSRTRNAKWGPQDVVQDSKYLDRNSHQLKRYFSELAGKLQDARSLVIFGPGNTGREFHKELLAHHKSLAGKVLGVYKADSLTENQIRALVRDYYLKGA